MIKIECDSVLYEDGDGKVQISAEVKGRRENVKYEIYTIMKYFETYCKAPYTDAVQMIYKDAGIEEEENNVSDTK